MSEENKYQPNPDYISVNVPVTPEEQKQIDCLRAELKATEVLGERHRQINDFGYSAERDASLYKGGELAKAAAIIADPDSDLLRMAYCFQPGTQGLFQMAATVKGIPRRRQLIIAAALMLAAIDTFDILDDRSNPPTDDVPTGVVPRYEFDANGEWKRIWPNAPVSNPDQSEFVFGGVVSGPTPTIATEATDRALTYPEGMGNVLEDVPWASPTPKDAPVTDDNVDVNDLRDPILDETADHCTGRNQPGSPEGEIDAALTLEQAADFIELAKELGAVGENLNESGTDESK